MDIECKGPSHYAGCPCHEAGRDKELHQARAEWHEETKRAKELERENAALKEQLRLADEAIKWAEKFVPRVSIEALKNAPTPLYSEGLVKFSEAIEAYRTTRSKALAQGEPGGTE